MDTEAREIVRLILASSSPRRRELLASLGLEFDIAKPDIDETRLPGEYPLAYARRLSREKADKVAQGLGDARALILSADTIVVLHSGAGQADDRRELLGKPADAAEARRMLRRLRGRAHEVITAFTVCHNDQPARAITRHERTVVHMRDYSDAEIAAYVATGDPLDKAGGYAIQNQAFQPVARIDGSYSNVVGLPLDKVSAVLREMGYNDWQ